MGVDLATAQSQATAVTTAVANSPITAQTAWTAATSAAANQVRIAAGGVAAYELVTQGFDPSSEDDDQRLITAVAGGVSLIPGVGPMLGGAIGVLDIVGEAIGDVLQAIGLIPPPGCTQKNGGLTVADVLSFYQNNGAIMGPGSFGALAYPALAQDVVAGWSCKPAYGASAILTGLIQLWNNHALGVLQNVWVPGEDWTLQSDGSVTTTGGGGPTNIVASAFGSGATSAANPLRLAFVPVNSVGISGIIQSPSTLDPQGFFGPWTQAALASGPFVGPGTVTSSKMSTGAKVAVGAGLTVAAAAGGIGIYSAVTGATFAAVLDTIGDRAVAWATGAREQDVREAREIRRKRR